MKRRTKVVLILSSCLVAGGLILGTVGLACGAKHHIYWSTSGVHVVDPSQQMQVLTKELEPFHTVEVDVSQVDVKLEPSDHYGLSINTIGAEVNWEIEDGALRLHQDTSEGLMFFNMDFRFLDRGQDATNTVVIYYPSDVDLESANICLSSGTMTIQDCSVGTANFINHYGDIVVDGLTADSLNVELSSGEASLSHVQAGTLSYENQYGDSIFSEITADQFHTNCESGKMVWNDGSTGSWDAVQKYGDITVSGVECDETTIVSESGNLSLDGSWNGTTGISAKYGDVNIIAHQSVNDTGYRLNTSYGDVWVNQEKYEGAISQLGRENEIQITGESGDIHLRFEES